MSHLWQPAADEFEDEIMPLLKQHGKAIGAACSQGDQLAQEIVNKYEMLRRSFDPITSMILKERVNQWVAELNAARCPNCDNVGFYPVQRMPTGEPELEQCEWCYRTPNSLFNVKAKRKK